MQEHPFVFYGGVTIYFWCGGLNICSLSLVWAGCYPQGAEHVSREKEAMGRASIQCLIAGLLTVARTCGKVAKATPSCKALGSNEPQVDIDSA